VKLDNKLPFTSTSLTYTHNDKYIPLSLLMILYYKKDIVTDRHKAY